MTADPTRFDYAAAAAGICRDFPGVAPKTYFFDSAHGTAMTAHPVAARRLDTLMKTDAGFARQLGEFMQKLRADKSSCVLAGAQNDHFVFLYTAPQKGGLLPNAPDAQRLHFILDHEIGHIVTATGKPDLKKSASLHEATADVFASLRHIQRFGRATGAIENLSLLRAQRLVSLHGTRHTEHFSTVVLEKLLEKLPAIDAEYLTPRQTAAIASRIAAEHTPHDAFIAKLSRSFAPFKDMLAAGMGGDGPYRMLAAIVLGNDDPDVFTYGAPVLRGYMTASLGPMRNGKDHVQVNDAPLKSAYWDEVGRELTKRSFAANAKSAAAARESATAKPARRLSPLP